MGPILFLLCVNDIFPCASHPYLSMFADDSECLKEIISPQDFELLQEDFDQLVEWCNVSLLKFNASKCVLLRFRCEISPHSYSVHGDTIPLCTAFKNLGVLLSSDLSWSSHIAAILAKAGLIKRVLPYSCRVDLKRSLYLSLVKCYLSFCMWRPHLLHAGHKKD